ncbi:MAG: hypothetical protein CR975_00965 [Gammaproteobacteria bacterium]|nr:MAG: hypothetical protein CR975_00965 [Gammaproteobacteria bacterium]
MDSSYTKITAWIFFIALCFVVFDAFVRPYAAAYGETKRILKEANIPIEKKASGDYRQRSIAVLAAQCKNGLNRESSYELHCVIDSPLPYWSSRLLSH